VAVAVAAVAGMVVIALVVQEADVAEVCHEKQRDL
jgi:hypothetical protein